MHTLSTPMTLTMCLQITYSGQETSMATISAEDPRNQVPRARIAHVIQMNLDSPNKLQAAFKRAFGALLATDNKEYLDVGSNMHFIHTLRVLFPLAIITVARLACTAEGQLECVHKTSYCNVFSSDPRRWAT